MANDKDPVFCAADIIKRAKLAKEFKTDRELPVDSFYVDKRTLAPDNYCKECRRAMSNARYRRSLPASNPLRYPVITEISDCTLRMYLILNALKVVRESVLRKRKRLCEAGDIE